ncbi:MAG: hypothetical protein IJJ28_07160 [Lentisphaeria bacterium]|nr:hypothetical protein [Lentisphaeria bacterium]
MALSKLYNTGIGDDPMFPRLDAKLIAEIARIAAADRAKFQLATANGRLGAIVLSGTPDDGRPVQPVRIPIDTTATGASFLVTAAAFNNYGLANLKGGLSVGELEVVYADGKRAELPLIAFRNLNDWNSYLGGNACRAVLRGNDRNGALFSFYAIDWRNPRPQSAIKEIVFASNGKSLLAPALLALSLSDAGAVPAGAPGAPEFAVATERRPAKTAIIADFSRGMPKSWSRLANGVPGYRAKIVDDPERGKVLEIDIPGTAKPLSRAGIDLPLNDPCDFKNIAFDIRVSDFDSVFRADFYVMNRQATNVMGILGYAPFLGDNWQTECLARERFVPKEGGGIDPAKANRIRIGFFLHGGIRPTKIRIAKVYFSDRMLPGRCNKLIPGK